MQNGIVHVLKIVTRFDLASEMIYAEGWTIIGSVNLPFPDAINFRMISLRAQGQEFLSTAKFL